MSFADIRGQQFAVTLLQRAIEKNRLASTYLFYGQSGVGKRLTARVFTKALNCEKLRGDSCDICSSCNRIEKNGHPDVHWIFPTGASRSIGIDDIRGLQRAVSWMAYEGKTKISIIVDAETMNPEAGNALLKTLEEPPPNSLFILVSSSPDAILSTVRSRARQIQFNSLKKDTISKLLMEKAGLSQKTADFYSSLCNGSIGKALELKDEEVFNRRKSILDVLEKGSFNNMGALMEKVEELIDNSRLKESLVIKSKKEGKSASREEAYIMGEYRKQTEEMFTLISYWYRDILVSKIANRPECVINFDYLDRINYWKDRFSIDDIEEKMDIMKDIKVGLDRNISLKLLLEVMFIRLGLI